MKIIFYVFSTCSSGILLMMEDKNSALNYISDCFLMQINVNH